MVSSNFHTRSNSLPSRPHPLVPQINEHLCRLRASSCSSSSSIRNNLSGLQDLYDLVDSFLQLSHTQQALPQNKQIDELLDASLRLLDVCGTTKDALLQTKEQIQEIQSVLRRRLGDASGLANEYLTSRKKTKKVIHRFLRDLKSKSTISPLEDDAEATVSILRKVEGVILNVFQSLLSYIYGRNAHGSWLLVSKLMHSKRIACEKDETDMNEFEKVDAALCNLIKGKPNKTSTENVQNVLRELESSIRDLEEGLECLLRRLIKTRVSLLNILNH